MPFSIIAAIGSNGVIGRKNQLPWHLPNDMHRFKNTTIGHTVVMGRKTYESIGHALVRRRNVVITKDLKFAAPNIEVLTNLDAVLELDNNGDEVMVIGGGVIYDLMLEFTSTLYLTHIHAHFEGDQFFPAVDFGDWTEMFRQFHEKDSVNSFSHTFVTMKRVIQGR